MCVRLVTHFAEIWLVRRVNVHVFLSVAAVCKSSVASLKLTLERFLSCRGKKRRDFFFRLPQAEVCNNKRLCRIILLQKLSA